MWQTELSPAAGMRLPIQFSLKIPESGLTKTNCLFCLIHFTGQMTPEAPKFPEAA